MTAIQKADKWLRSPRYPLTSEPVILALKAELVAAYAVIATTTNREPAEYVRDEARRIAEKAVQTPRRRLKVVSP